MGAFGLVPSLGTNYTIHIENHSKIDIEVRCISLWSEGQKVSKDAFPPENGWLDVDDVVAAGRN